MIFAACRTYARTLGGTVFLQQQDAKTSQRLLNGLKLHIWEVGLFQPQTRDSPANTGVLKTEVKTSPVSKTGAGLRTLC